MKPFSVIIPIAIGALTCSLLASCEKENPVTGNESNQTTTALSVLSFSDKNDPEGTIWLTIDNNSYQLSSGAHSVYVSWSFPDNLNCKNDYPSRDVEMVRVGKISGLKDINISQIPEVGWATKMSCEPGYGYIIRYGCYNQNEESNTYYYGLGVVDHLYEVESSGICGAKIKYCPFTPGLGWNK